jgi:hypothetical protein
MSQGPILRPTNISLDIYSRADKWDFQNALFDLPLIWRYDCDCLEGHLYGCPRDAGYRPESIPDARAAIGELDPIWQKVLDVLETNPEVHIYCN